MARTPVLAAGGIVLRRETPPRFAVVRLRKRNEWVLPKGKLDDGETARAAAEREVLEGFTLDLDTRSLPLGGPADLVQLTGGSLEFGRDRVNTAIQAVDLEPLAKASTLERHDRQ